MCPLQDVAGELVDPVETGDETIFIALDTTAEYALYGERAVIAQKKLADDDVSPWWDDTVVPAPWVDIEQPTAGV